MSLRRPPPSPALRSRLAGLGLGLAAGLLGLSLLAPAPAEAFCGFYVAGADAELYANATMVVLMREGERTVLAMQNDYQGPPEDFAMVIPVPVVLQEGDVQTLDPALFDRVDKLAAPRLVEYWEQDPCNPSPYGVGGLGLVGTGRGGGGTSSGYGAGKLGVKVEAEFEVEEYEVVILSAEESTGLDTWLRQENYNIPEGAEPLLRPYVEGGSKFFVAKVDADKVKFVRKPDGSKQAELSPLRFHYDSKEFSLPIRLGLINAPQGEGGGQQDLLVHILAPHKRYDVANYPKATIPTNLDVKDEVRERFGEFYVSLFDHTLAQNPKAVITEYAWSAGSCDPCPEPPLRPDELAELGAEVLPSYAAQAKQARGNKAPSKSQGGIGLGGMGSGFARDFVLTRLHARYDAASLGEDLVFEQAPAIVGGRERRNEAGELETGAQPASEHGFDAFDNFQARYAIRHEWEGAIECEEPQRGIWGPKPKGGPSKPSVAQELAYAPRGGSLGSFVSAGSAAQLQVAINAPPTPEAADDAAGETGEAEAEAEAEAESKPESKPKAESKSGCKCTATSDDPLGSAPAGLAALGLLLGLRRRRRFPHV